MKLTAKQSSKRAAFTIVELLTVMSIIVILISILVPGLNMAKRYAKKVRQSAQFHSLGIALEFFNVEQEGYPNSAVSATSPYTTGAHHLAEALVGRDMQGFDPMSTWDAQADETVNTIYGKIPAEEVASLERREGPYLKLENIGAFQVEQLYTGTIGAGTVYDGNATPAPVFTDVYRVKRVTLPGSNKVVKAGTPILYYKADISSTTFDDALPADSIYNSLDNEDLIKLGKIMNQTEQHRFDPDVGGRQIFYETITNPQIRPLVRPYNQDSYILISAGFDGLYGTRDDVYNFGN